MLFIIIKKKFNLMQFLSKKPFLANNIYKLTSFLLYIIIFTRLTRKLISIHNITRPINKKYKFTEKKGPVFTEVFFPAALSGDDS